MKSYLYSCFACLILSSCGGGGSGGGRGGGEVLLTPATAETINGIAVPPPPVNPGATVAGTDINANGVRDDVERALATTYGAIPDVYSPAFDVAKKIQTVLTVTPAQQASAIKNFMAATPCPGSQSEVYVKEANFAVLDTRARQIAFIEAYVSALKDQAAIPANNNTGLPACQ